mgnify:CR=1 FL=1
MGVYVYNPPSLLLRGDSTGNGTPAVLIYMLCNLDGIKISQVLLLMSEAVVTAQIKEIESFSENDNVQFLSELALKIPFQYLYFLQFSHGATDLELTTKRDRYPLFFRTVPTEFVFNEPRLQFINKFGWKDEIGLIYDASPYYSLVSLLSSECPSMFVLSFVYALIETCA